MKQFIRIPRTLEVSGSLILEILKGRFPECKTSIHGNEIRLRKNALTTVCVKCRQENQERVITIDTKLFWWIWLFIGWVFYLISKKGFTDEVYSALVRDLSNRFPNKFRKYPSAYDSAIWSSKTKPLFWVGLFIVIYGIIFHSFVTEILMFLEYCFIGDWAADSKVHLFIWTKNFWINSLLWMLLGVYFLRLKQLCVGKRTGIFLVIFGVLSFASNFLFVGEHSIISAIAIQTCFLILLLCVGYFCKSDLRTGPARYFNISISIYAIANFIGSVLLITSAQLAINSAITLNENRLYYYLIMLVISLVIIPADFMFLRALHKMPKYPPIKNISGNDESTELGINDAKRREETVFD